MDATRPRGRRARAPFLSWLLLWVGGLAALVVVSAFLWTRQYDRRVFPGVSVGIVSLGGHTWEGAHTRLTKAYPHEPLPPVQVQWGEHRWWVPATRAFLVYPVEDSVEQAYEIGRVGSPQRQWQERIHALMHGHRIPISGRVDARGVRAWLYTLATRIYRPLREPEVIVEEGRVRYIPGAPSQELDVDQTWQRLYHALQARAQGRLNIPPVELVIRGVAPSPMDTRALENVIQRLLEPLRLKARDRYLALDPVAVRQVLTITPKRTSTHSVDAQLSVDRERLHTILTSLADRYARQPVDARLDYDPQRDAFTVISPSLDGWAMEVDKATDQVAQGLLQGQQEVSIPAGPVAPRVPDTATPAQLGIREIVGEGQTSFRGSSPARVHNIVRAAEAVRGVVVPPGEIFSFNDAVGAITAANGYEDSLIIWGDQTAVGIGGGVCQVSTTLFRAVFFAGLPIIERWNHGYIVSWYGEPGLDATVFSPYVDFKFKNTTPAYLLIQPIIDLDRGVLTFRLWGTSPGWTVEVIGPTQEDVVQPPPPLYKEDPALPPGTIRQVEWAKPGMTVRVRRIVRRGDEVIEDEEFVSRYQPWRAVFLYGPGTEVPKK